APAMRIDIAPGLWSRPTTFWEIGMRPNSECHSTSVSSKSPRRFRSVIRPDRLVDLSSMLPMVLHDAVVRIPGIDVLVPLTAAEQLYEPHDTLDQPPSQQALSTE